MSELPFRALGLSAKLYVAADFPEDSVADVGSSCVPVQIDHPGTTGMQREKLEPEEH